MAYRVSCYTHSPHLKIPISFKIVIYLILEHNYLHYSSIPLAVYSIHLSFVEKMHNFLCLIYTWLSLFLLVVYRFYCFCLRWHTLLSIVVLWGSNPNPNQCSKHKHVSTFTNPICSAQYACRTIGGESGQSSEHGSVQPVECSQPCGPCQQ